MNRTPQRVRSLHSSLGSSGPQKLRGPQRLRVDARGEAAVSYVVLTLCIGLAGVFGFTYLGTQMSVALADDAAASDLRGISSGAQAAEGEDMRNGSGELPEERVDDVNLPPRADQAPVPGIEDPAPVAAEGDTSGAGAVGPGRMNRLGMRLDENGEPIPVSITGEEVEGERRSLFSNLFTLDFWKGMLTVPRHFPALLGDLVVTVKMMLDGNDWTGLKTFANPRMWIDGFIFDYQYCAKGQPRIAGESCAFTLFDLLPIAGFVAKPWVFKGARALRGVTKIGQPADEIAQAGRIAAGGTAAAGTAALTDNVGAFGPAVGNAVEQRRLGTVTPGNAALLDLVDYQDRFARLIGRVNADGNPVARAGADYLEGSDAARVANDLNPVEDALETARHAVQAADGADNVGADVVRAQAADLVRVVDDNADALRAENPAFISSAVSDRRARLLAILEAGQATAN